MKTHARNSENVSHIFEKQAKKNTEQPDLSVVLQAYFHKRPVTPESLPAGVTGFAGTPQVPDRLVPFMQQPAGNSSSRQTVQRKLIVGGEDTITLHPGIEEDYDVNIVYVLGSWLREQKKHSFATWEDAIQAAEEAIKTPLPPFIYPGQKTEPSRSPLRMPMPGLPLPGKSRKPFPSSLRSTTLSTAVIDDDSSDQESMPPAIPIPGKEKLKVPLPPNPMKMPGWHKPPPVSSSKSSTVFTDGDASDKKSMPPVMPIPAGEKPKAPLLTEQTILATIRSYSSPLLTRITLSPAAPITEAKAKAEAYASRLFDIQNQIQIELDTLAPDRFKCLVRFYVKDPRTPATHPGLNSWFYHRRQTSPGSTELSASPLSQPESTADTHMLLGHDVHGASIRHSPFVSTTENVQELLKTDSPYNQEGRSLALMSANTQQETSRFKNFKPQKQEAQYYSDRIAILTHGQSSHDPTIPVATHIAFLVVPLHRLYYPPASASPASCCRLEKEVTIFAPDVDLARWMVGEVTNDLPELTGHGRHTDTGAAGTASAAAGGAAAGGAAAGAISGKP